MTDHALEFYPLTSGQMDFWHEWREQPDLPLSTVAHAVWFAGKVDHAALVRAITATIAETDAAALRFRVGPDGQPLQAVDPAHRPLLHQIDLSADPDASATTGRMMQADIARPPDLLGPMSAWWLIRLPDGGAVWYLRGHHIFLDGYAMALIENRCAAHYAQALGMAKTGPGFAPLRALIEEEREARASPRHAADRAWWRARLDAQDLPTVPCGSADYAAEPMTAEIDLSALAGPLHRMAGELRMGWPDLLTLLAGLWLCSAQGRATTIWLPWMGRLGSVAARVPAMVVNILPLAIEPPQDASLGQALEGLTADLRDLRRHGRYRIEDISRDQGLDESQRFLFSPLVNVMPFDPPQFPGCAVRRDVLAAGPGDGTNLTFAANSRGDGLMVAISADPAMTTAPEFARLRDGLSPFLAHATAPGACAMGLAALARRA